MAELSRLMQTLDGREVSIITIEGNELRLCFTNGDEDEDLALVVRADDLEIELHHKVMEPTWEMSERVM